MTTCEEAKNMKSGINVQGKIERKSEVRIKLTLWADDTEKVKDGDTVSITGGYTTEFRNETQLNKGRKDGKLEIISG